MDSLDWSDPSVQLRCVALVLLLLYLPLTAFSYYLFRRKRRAREVERVLSIMNVDSLYRDAYEGERMGLHLFLSVAYTTAVAAFGLTVLFLGRELGLDAASPMELPGKVSFPREGWRPVTGMAFAGGYVWGIQYVFRRYTTNDLIPAVYQYVSVRMILSAAVTLVVYGGYEALTGPNGGDGDPGITTAIWPAFGFVMGMFPQRALHWLTNRVPILASEPDPTKRSTPLEMIEGIELLDRMRLEELGIETCYDLANADFVPLTLRTPYSARQLVDWILQAKLCALFGPDIRELREKSIRTAVDLKEADPATFPEIAATTRISLAGLRNAHAATQRDSEIDRLRKAAERLGRFWRDAEA